MPSPLRRLRKRLGLTQEAVAERLGITQAMVSKGERNGFSLDVARRVADAYGINVLRLLPVDDASGSSHVSSGRKSA